MRRIDLKHVAPASINIYIFGLYLAESEIWSYGYEYSNFGA